MTIKIRTLRDGGASVQFPYDLKDDFRKRFRSAKWNPTLTRWEVGTRSIKRLEQWVEEVEKSGLLEALDAEDQVEMTEREVEDLAGDLRRMKTKIEEARNAAERLQKATRRRREVIAEMEGIREQLAAAQETRAAAETEAESARLEIEEKVSKVVDIEEIEKLRKGMSYDWKALKAANHARFDEKQARMIEIRDELKAVGIKSRAVHLAASANWNRPDRDRQDLCLDIEFAVAKPDVEK